MKFSETFRKQKKLYFLGNLDLKSSEILLSLFQAGGFESNFSCFCASAPDLFSGEFLHLKPSEISLSFFSVSSGSIFSPISFVSVVLLYI